MEKFNRDKLIVGSIGELVQGNTVGSMPLPFLLVFFPVLLQKSSVPNKFHLFNVDNCPNYTEMSNIEQCTSGSQTIVNGFFLVNLQKSSECRHGRVLLPGVNSSNFFSYAGGTSLIFNEQLSFSKKISIS